MNREPWTGCYPESTGCDNCYFYGPNAKRFGQNTITKTFDWPIRRNKKDEYNIKGDKILATCFATDFFLPEANEWRKDAWAMIKQRIYWLFAIIGGYCDLSPYLSGVNHVTVIGENGRDARPCNYDWVLDIRDQCSKAGVTFWFKSTGTFFLA